MSIVKLNNNGVKNATSFGSASSGAMTFIKKLTASSSSTLSFVNGSSDVVFDSTYKEYLFTFNNVHPATDGGFFSFQADTGTNTNYNQTITSGFWYAGHNESGANTALNILTGADQAQGTGFQPLTEEIGNGNDESASGYLHLFNPSSSTFVKHFACRSNTYQRTDYTFNSFPHGYFNTTTALTRVQFKFDNGNIDSGDICLYGIN